MHRAAVLTISMAFATQAFGFGLSTFTGSSDESSAGQDLGSVVEEQDKLVQRYVKASTEILTAQKLLSEAFGLKGHAAALDAEIQALSSGATTQEDMEKASATSSNAQEKIDEKIKNGEKLSGAGREKYQKSLLPFAKGLLQTSALVPEFQGLLESAKTQIESAPMTKKLDVKKQLDTGVYVATKMPTHMTDLTSATKRVLTYAKSQKLKTDVAEDEIANLI
jgi:hypothetical protein